MASNNLQQYAGYIYIMVNPAFTNLIKIGYADNLKDRVNQLSHKTAVPDPYHVYASYKIQNRLQDIEVHRLIDSLNPSLRHNANKEFYEMSPEDAYAIFESIAKITSTENLLEKNPLKDPYFNTTVSNTNINTNTNTNTKSVQINLSPLVQYYNDFWIALDKIFNNYSNIDNISSKGRQDCRIYYCGRHFVLGKSKWRVVLSLDKKNARVCIAVHTRHKEAFNLYQTYLNNKNAIENALGYTLDWDQNNTNTDINNSRNINYYIANDFSKIDANTLQKIVEETINIYNEFLKYS